MKILWHSNAAWATTGYGQQTALFAPRLTDHHDVTISAFYGLEGAKVQFNEKIGILPGISGQFGNEQIQGHAKATFGGDLRGGLVMTLMDVWVLDPAVWRTMDVACWTPIDHMPAPPAVTRFFVGSGAIPIAMSRFGMEQLAEFDPLYCPHAVDTSVYVPTPKEEARAQVGFDKDAFIVGVVAANKGVPSRKCFPEILQAFAIFQRDHPDAKLYLHTEVLGVDHGLHLPSIIDSIGIPDDAVMFTDQYRYRYDPVRPRLMSQLYSAFDVLLAPSRGEGFGIPVLEAQASGTPAIVSDFSAQPEVCGAGWHISGRPEWSAQQSWQFLPDVEDMIDALERCHGLSVIEQQQLSAKACAHALSYDVDVVLTKYMLPALEAVSERYEARRPLELAAAA